jgi:CubicO group peptidase (beta-lactamase class C family)
MQKTLSRLLLVLVPLLLLGCSESTVPPADEKQAKKVYMGELFFTPEEEALYLKRYDISMNRGDYKELYQPRGPMLGAPDWKPLPAAKPQERTISDRALDDATAYAAGNNSTAFIVWRDGKIETETYFGSDSRTSELNAFSLTKPITSFAVGRAIMLGKINSLDQPVADFVSEWKGDPQRSRILVRHLLDMRAGFLRQGSSAGPDEIMSRSFLHPRSEEILIGEYPVVDEPGTRFEYNNAASAMVAILIERATGRRYDEFVGTEVLQKIGALGGKVWLNRKGGVAQSGCCMLVPAETFLRLGILTLQDGVWDGQRLLPESYVADMTKGTEADPYYGLNVYVATPYTERRGWGNPDLPIHKVLHSEPYLAADLYLFDGNMNQVVYMIPSQNLVILRMGRMPPRSEESEWDNAYLPNLIMRGIVSEMGSSVPQPR